MDQERYTNRGRAAAPRRPDNPRRRQQAAPNRQRSLQASPTQRRRERQPSAESQRRTIRRPQPIPEEIPEVVYTPPRPFHLGRFSLKLVTMVAVVLAMVFGFSLFFRAQVVTVSGTDKYTPWAVLKASGIQMGDSLIPLNEARISGRIISNLPYVQDVRVGIRLPDTVMIQVQELPVSYAVESRDGTWWLMSASGRLVEEIPGSKAQNYTRIQGVQITLPVVGEQAVAAEAAQSVIGDSVVATVSTGAQRLELAESILQAMENAGFLGNMDAVDVTDTANLMIWSAGQRFKLQLGNKSRLEDKLSYAKSAMDQLAAYESGVLDISLSGEDKVIFTPAV